MDKRFLLKTWLNLSDAANQLTRILGELISVADVLQLALDRRLRLSVLLVNSVIARAVRLMRDDEVLDSEVESFYMPTGDGLIVGPNTVELEGLYDVPMFGAEVYDVSDAYHSATGGPKFTGDTGHGAFLMGAHGQLFQLGINKEGRGNRGHWLWPARLPNDAVFVVRREELRRFEGALEPEPTVSDFSRMPPKLKELIRAWEKFWRNVDPADRGLHYTNAEIAEWLVERRFSRTLADMAATIIRPEGAPLGRLPQEK